MLIAHRHCSILSSPYHFFVLVLVLVLVLVPAIDQLILVPKLLLGNALLKSSALLFLTAV